VGEIGKSERDGIALLSWAIKSPSPSHATAGRPACRARRRRHLWVGVQRAAGGKRAILWAAGHEQMAWKNPLTCATSCCILLEVGGRYAMASPKFGEHALVVTPAGNRICRSANASYGIMPEK